jgi:hypothetical protein
MNFSQVITARHQSSPQEIQGGKEYGDIGFVLLNGALISELGGVRDVFLEGRAIVADGFGQVPSDLRITIMAKGDTLLVGGDGR